LILLARQFSHAREIRFRGTLDVEAALDAAAVDDDGDDLYSSVFWLWPVAARGMM